MNTVAKSLSDLSFDRLWSGNAERDRNTSLQIGVYRGRASMAIFSGQGSGPKLKLPLPRQHNVFFRTMFAAVRKSGPDSKLTVPVQEWDPESKKMNPIATVTFGLDAANQPYIGITATGFEATKFPIRSDLKWDTSTLTEVNGPQLALDSFFAAMDSSIQAMNLSNFKFDPTQQRPGAGGGRGSIGGQGSTSAAAGTSVEDDSIPF